MHEKIILVIISQPLLLIGIPPLNVIWVTVFNLEIMESGSNVPRDILNWVISKMGWVKLL